MAPLVWPPCIVKITLEVDFAVAARNRRKTRNARETSLRSASHVSGKRGIARICCFAPCLCAAGRAAVDPPRPMAADPPHTDACSVRTGQTDGRTDGRTDTVSLHRPRSAYYAGSATI